MKKSLPKLEKISSSINSHQVYYKFNKMDEHLSTKYRKGRITAAKWLNDLIYYYIQKESNFITEFKTNIQEQREKISELKDGDYKQGLYDELEIIERMIKDTKPISRVHYFILLSIFSLFQII